MISVILNLDENNASSAVFAWNQKIAESSEEYEILSLEELVRCRWCKHYKPYQGKGMYCTKVVGAEYPRKEDDFCSDGERKDDATD